MLNSVHKRSYLLTERKYFSHSYRKRNKTPIVGDNGPQEQGEVYAVVKKKSRWSRTVWNSSDMVDSKPSHCKIEDVLISSLPPEDVYDHTLRPQINEENNYDSMACLNLEFDACENVYNTTNNSRKMKIFVEDEYIKEMQTTP